MFFCSDHFLFTYTIAFIHEPYNIFTCPLKAGEKNTPSHNPLLFLRLTRPHIEADWQAGEQWRCGLPCYLAGILARLRAMASSTALSCFRSSSRRDSVLLGLLEPEPAAAVEPGAAGLPNKGTGPFPDDLGGGDRGRFLSPWGGMGRGPWPLGRSIRGESGGRPGILLSRPLSGDRAILLLSGEPGLSLSAGR